MRSVYRRWSQYPYPGEAAPPKGSSGPGYWPMFFIKRSPNNEFYDPFQQRINWRIKDPNQIEWTTELAFVEKTLNSITPQQIELARFWGTAEFTKRIDPLIFNFAEKYQKGSPSTARILANFHAAINDIIVITWYLKYLWDVARPNQYDPNLRKILSTPLFPSYPSAHASIAGCAEVILSYFFPPESAGIKRIMEDAALSRLYAGVHYNIDNQEGLILGRQLGEIVVKVLKAQNV